nr:hypothetical protein [Lactobacillus johnsonii]
MSDQSNQGLSFFPYYIKRNDLVSLAKMVKELLHSFNQEFRSFTNNQQMIAHMRKIS